ncbi:hypothetical protein BH20ACT19_BH20ACT19_03850 [soil metagenome]
MARYTQSSIERLKQTVDMVAIVSKRTDLRRVGSRHVGLCPFHDERTPSFSVDAERGLYHCLGCRRGGDAFSFVMETEGLDFATALEQLAQDARVELEREREDPREEERRSRRERLLALLDRTAGFYASYLWKAADAAPAREYLLGRGLSEEVLRDFRVGYAPEAWERVTESARSSGFSDEELLGAGLAQRSRRGGLIDRFRERTTFPLADARGRVLGFGARAMRDEQGAKYLNTAEGELYHKGRLLFGIDKARQAIAKAGRVVVVEGYTDVLALHGAGIAETVAIMGTALTREQLSELARAVGEDGTVHLALDADRSGREAMMRAAGMARERGISLRVVAMPEGVDPADLVAEGGEEAVAARLAGSQSVVEFSVEQVLAKADLDSYEGRDRALVEARGLIASTPPRSATRDHLVRSVADRLDVPASYVVGDQPAVRGAAPSHRPAPSERGTAPVAVAPGAGSLEAERVFLALCMGAGQLGREHLERLEPSHFSSDLTRRARDHLLAHFDDPLAGLSGCDPPLGELVAGVVVQADSEGAPEEGVLGMTFLALELRRIEREARRARQEGDRKRQRELAADRQRVRRDMDTVMGQVT